MLCKHVNPGNRGAVTNWLQETEQPEINLSGWEHIDRSVKEIELRVRQEENEEQIQTGGLLCKETIIPLVHEIFIEEKHPSLGGVKASKTDAKRMLDVYIAIEFAGSANENIRKYASAFHGLANESTHNRTATSKMLPYALQPWFHR